MTPLPRPDYRALERYDPDRAPAGIDLSDNTNLWGTHPAALARIRSATTDDLARYPELYADTLRRAVVERFGVAPACVTTGAGSDDVLDSAFRAAYAPGAVVSYAAPTFSMVQPLARVNGMEARPVPWPEALDDPMRLLEGDPAVVYVCRPDNPTGKLAPAEWVERLLEPWRAGATPARPLLIVDEAYADFAGETLLARAPAIAGLLVTRTASKAYGLAGLRCGFAVGAPDVVLEVEKSRGPYKVARLAAEAGAAAVRDADGWMAARVAECVANRDTLWRLLDERGLRPLPSRANFLLFAAPGGSASADAARLRALGVGVRPFAGVPLLGEALRVTVGPWPLMEGFLGALDRLVAGTAVPAVREASA